MNTRKMDRILESLLPRTLEVDRGLLNPLISSPATPDVNTAIIPIIATTSDKPLKP